MKTRIARVGWGEKDRQHISINAIAQRRDETKKEGEKIKFWNETYSLAGARSSSGVIVKVKPAKGTEPFSSFFFSVICLLDSLNARLFLHVCPHKIARVIPLLVALFCFVFLWFCFRFSCHLR